MIGQKRINPTMEDKVKAITSIRLKQKQIFLKRCESAEVLLPSFYKRGIDRDLLLAQQRRNLKISLRKISDQIKSAYRERRKTYRANLYEFSRIENKWKKFYIKKFDRLFSKQRQLINDSRKVNRKIKKNKKDYRRYKNRRTLKKRENEIKQANSIVLNKSNIELQDCHKKLLSKGLNFVVTPKWDESIESLEWLSLQRHIRASEWASVFENDSHDSFQKMPDKLKLPKYNRPEQGLVDDKIQVYCEMIRSKLRNLKTKVNHNFYHRHNLDPALLQAFEELKTFVKEKKIVICRSDKDGMIVVVDYCDYKKIMEKELMKLNQVKILNTKNVDEYFDKVRLRIQEMMTDLHREDVVNDTLLKHVVGMKCIEKWDDDMKCMKKVYNKVPGLNAKHFKCNEPAYAYPLFKTHKLEYADLRNTCVFDIPTRLLQSAGNITTSRVTTFIEMILQPVSIKFCSYGINEYCRDSKSYLETLDEWKSNYDTDKCNSYLVAADVQALYPNVMRKLVRSGLQEALQLCSDYKQSAIDLITELTMFCLEHVVVRNGESFYNQAEGIITGDNHSVSIANITLHHIILPIAAKLNKTILFKRYIDDIIWISETEELTNEIQSVLSATFQENGLRLTFRKISTEDQNHSLEFLDVNHIIHAESPGGFYTTNFTKPTAVNRLFLNGQSYHPTNVYKSIIFGESIRLRRLNEKNCNYLKAIEQLQSKCLKSGFGRKLVQSMINITSQWTERFAPPQSNKKRQENSRTV